MANLIHTPGPTTILNITSTTTGPGDWYRVDGRVTQLALMALHVGTSAGVTVASTIQLQASNDGVNPLATVLGTVSFNGATPQADGFVTQRWEYIRANVNSASSSTAAGTAYNIKVVASATMQAGS